MGFFAWPRRLDDRARAKVGPRAEKFEDCLVLAPPHLTHLRVAKHGATSLRTKASRSTWLATVVASLTETEPALLLGPTNLAGSLGSERLCAACILFPRRAKMTRLLCGKDRL